MKRLKEIKNYRYPSVALVAILYIVAANVGWVIPDTAVRLIEILIGGSSLVAFGEKVAAKILSK